jgi:hypothetical protein
MSQNHFVVLFTCPPTLTQLLPHNEGGVALALGAWTHALHRFPPWIPSLPMKNVNVRDQHNPR